MNSWMTSVVARFAQVQRMTLTCSVYYLTIWSILNHHALVLHKTVTTVFRTWINDEILTAKRLRRKAERWWRRADQPLICCHSVDVEIVWLSFWKKHAVPITLTLLVKLSQPEKIHYLICRSALVSLYILIPVKWLMILEIARQCYSSGVSDSHLALYGPSFSEFRLLSETEVLELIKSSTKTTFSLDPIPSKLFTECLDILLTPITKLINLSLELGCFPLLWKRALVKPLLKNDGLDPFFKNFRPVSNLAYASKLVETVVAKQLQHYLFINDLFPIDLIHKWLPIHYSFVLVQISLPSLTLEQEFFSV